MLCRRYACLFLLQAWRGELTLKFSACIDDLWGWMQSNRLKLNADKTECVWVTTRQQRWTFAASNLIIEGSIIVPIKGARNLVVFFDSKLDLQTVRRSLQPEMLKTLLHDFVSCRLDYCNSLSAGLLACHIAQLQSVQNAAARLFGGVSKYDSVTSVLRDVLQWLPFKERINFKIGVLTYKALHGLAPSYLSEMLVPVAVSSALRWSRSADRGDLTVPRGKNTSYSDRSFAIAAPMLWNSFPVELLCISSMTIFLQKSYLFREAYNIVSPPTDWSWLYNVKHPEVLAYDGRYINSIIMIIIRIIIIIIIIVTVHSACVSGPTHTAGYTLGPRWWACGQRDSRWVHLWPCICNI